MNDRSGRGWSARGGGGGAVYGLGLIGALVYCIQAADFVVYDLLKFLAAG